MQVQVHTDDHVEGSEALAQWVSGQAQSRLSRFQDNVSRLEVFLSDVDAGKSGSNDKRCRIEARVNGRQPITVAGDADKLPVAFMSATDKLARALDTGLARARGGRNGRETIRTAAAAD